jgi:Putative metallopeptidase domain
MGYGASELDELSEKYKYHTPEEQQATEKTFHLANQRLEYAIRILGAAHWWLGWRGALMGKPILTVDPEISTAAVGFNPINSKIDYFFNVWFAASLSAGDIAFVIAHECMHLIFGHVRQMKQFGIEYPGVWNIATDAFINEFLKRTLKWSTGMRADERQDWTLQNGIYWKDLPKKVREKYPSKEGKEKGTLEIEHTCLEIYDAMIEDMTSKGIDPNRFEKGIENKSFGRNVKRKRKTERGEESSEEIVRQKVYVEPGDVVFVKSHGTYGLIEKLKRVQDQEGEADIFYADDITRPEWIWLSRAIGITTQLGTKSFQLSRKIVETYAKMKAAGARPMTWGPFAKAVGIPEIENLDEIDRLITEKDAADEAAVAEAQEDLNKKLEADVAKERERIMGAPLDTPAAPETATAELESEPASETLPATPEEAPEAAPAAEEEVPGIPPEEEGGAATPRVPLLPNIVALQKITAEKGPITFKPTVRDFKRQIAILAATAMEDFTYGPTEIFKTPADLKTMVNWLIRLQGKR